MLLEKLLIAPPLNQQLISTTLPRLSFFMENTMSKKITSSIIPVLAPYLCGVPSRRHHVVLRRAVAHHQELILFIKSLAKTATESHDPEVTRLHHDFVVKKIWLVSSAIYELENCTSATARVKIATDLQLLKARFQEVRNKLRL
jgi:hypothetical protein